jgi:hypothetical protein
MRLAALSASLLLIAACGGDTGAVDNALLHSDIAQHRQDVEVTFDATLLDNPVESGSHERFHVRTGSGDLLEVDHNIQLAALVPAKQGDQVVIRGRLYIDPGAAGVHCTHARTSTGCPEPGYIKLGSHTYE